MDKNRHADVLQRIAARRTEMSAKMLLLADYLGHHHVEASLWSARRLASEAGVSPSTVVRFVADLGYADYESFRSRLQAQINRELGAVERMQAVPDRRGAELLKRAIDADQECLTQLMHEFSETNFDRFCHCLLAAERVAIVGLRFLGSLSTYFGYSLAKIRDRVDTFTYADSSLYDRLSLMGPDDALVILTLPRYPKDVVSLARYARSRRIPVAAITDGAASPIMPHADHVLYARSSLLDFVGSLAAPAALINCLVTETAMRLGERAVARLRSIEQSATGLGTYL